MGNKTDSMTCQLFGTKCATGTLFTSPDNLFGNGSTSSREPAAVDAQYGTDKTWDFFKLVHGRNGIFGDGSGPPTACTTAPTTPTPSGTAPG